MHERVNERMWVIQHTVLHRNYIFYPQLLHSKFKVSKISIYIYIQWLLNCKGVSNKIA